jgi:hypothetical protein
MKMNLLSIFSFILPYLHLMVKMNIDFTINNFANVNFELLYDIEIVCIGW